ncbi:MAG: MFS transporter [Anaerolineae bacterium]
MPRTSAPCGRLSPISSPGSPGMAEIGKPAAASPPQPLVSLEADYRHNFPFFLADGTLFGIALGILGATTLVPDFMRRLTGSEILIGLSSNLFTIGWTLPQLIVARLIVRARRVKRWYVGVNVLGRSAIFIFAAAMLLLGVTNRQYILAAFFICYSTAALCDGLSSIPGALLSAGSLDKRWRARAYGLQGLIAGLLMLAIAPLIGLFIVPAGPGFPRSYLLLFGAAGVVFMLDILPVAFVRELPGGRAPQQVPPLREFVPGLVKLLQRDGPFRAMLITRLLSILFAMANPFYIGFATVQLGLASTVAVPVMLAMQTVGGLLGSLSLTWLGAHKCVLHIRLALACAALLPVSAFAAVLVGPLPLYIGFLASGLAMGSLFLGFLNWVISYPPPDQRPAYSGLFNSLTTVFALLAPVIGGTIAQRAGYLPLFGTSLAIIAAALFVALRYVPELSPGPA